MAEQVNYAAQTRVTVQYADGTWQSVHVFVLPRSMQAHAATFAATTDARLWLNSSSNDPFFRSNSWLNFDRRTDSVILQDTLAWVAGLSDECGAGPSVSMALQNVFAPVDSQVARLALYVNSTLWGSSAQRQSQNTVQFDNHGVRASMFFSGLPGYPYVWLRCGVCKLEGVE